MDLALRLIIDPNSGRSWVAELDAIYSERHSGASKGRWMYSDRDAEHALAPGGPHGAAQPEGLDLARLSALYERQVREENVRFDLVLSVY